MSLRLEKANGKMGIYTLAQLLPIAEGGHFAIGSFAPRYTPMIRAILRAAQASQSPAMVQISQGEMKRYQITPAEFADEFYRSVGDEHITVPLVLHLDHTREIAPIEQAIAAGFTSVMIDASERPLEENIALSKTVVSYAHARGVAVEAELGHIGRADGEGTASRGAQGYTDPLEARRFVRETGVDALAVSVGTAHGLYVTQEPRIDYARVEAIRALVPIPLVLHGGSGVPTTMLQKAIRLAGGGISKVNIATDLEVALLAALRREQRMSNAECKDLSPEELELGRAAVEQLVRAKIADLLSSGRAKDFTKVAQEKRAA